MRSPSLFALAVVLFAANCTTTDPSSPSCASDERLCPSIPKTATGVSCTCTCHLPHVPLAISEAKFSGSVAACLPPSLNPVMAAAADRQSITAMTSSQFSQAVYKYCSDDVASWLSLTIKSQLVQIEHVPDGLACEPYTCSCDVDANAPPVVTNNEQCSVPCSDIPCDDRSCDGILRDGGILQLSTCSCTRTTACGFTSPPTTRPGLCRPLGNAQYLR
jgi:hypothetical protein